MFSCADPAGNARCGILRSVHRRKGKRLRSVLLQQPSDSFSRAFNYVRPCFEAHVNVSPTFRIVYRGRVRRTVLVTRAFANRPQFQNTQCAFTCLSIPRVFGFYFIIFTSSVLYSSLKLFVCFRFNEWNRVGTLYCISFLLCV